MDEQLKPVLELFTQPAFFVENGSVSWCNSAARTLLTVGASLSSILGKEMLLFSLWTREGTLQIPLSLNGEEYDISVRASGSGDLFVATHHTIELNTTAATVVNASASLRRPLHMMVSAANELFDQIEDHCDIAAMTAASRLNQSIYQFVRLCGQMSDGGRLLLRKKELHRAPTNLTEFFQQFVDQVRPLVESAGVHLHYEPPSTSIHADADTALLERALYNLLSNALNYTPRGGNITLSLQRRDRHLLICVSDDGEGISPEVMATLFERFADSPLGDSRWGIGLGLPMVREIARLHDGTMSVGANEGGHGTSVTFSISLEPTALNLCSRIVSYDYCGDLHHGLVELSDVLDAKMFNPTEVL